MGRESHVRFREGLGVQFPRATRLLTRGMVICTLNYHPHRTGTTMNQTQIGNRVVVIAGPVPANENEKAGCRGTAGKAVRVRRTVVIRNGELVGSGAGR